MDLRRILQQHVGNFAYLLIGQVALHVPEKKS